MQISNKYWCIIICLFIISCNSGKQSNDKNKYELSLDELRYFTLQSENELIKDIKNFLNENKQRLFGNQLKGISALHLSDEQETFYNKRFDFFIAILDNNEEIKIEYYNYAKMFFKKFPINSRHYYFWSKDIFDFRLFDLLEDKFGEIKLPIKYFNEYYMEIDMFMGIDEN
jgi:hypothetical protein